MPRPKTPLARAIATGAARRNPARYAAAAARPVSNMPAVGLPPDWLKPDAQEAWLETVDEIPWLNKSHRGILTIVAILRARLREDDMGVKAMSLLRMCLGQLGATPADAHRVAMPTPVEDDPAEGYFQ